MRRLLTDTNTTFQLEDFSSASYGSFCNSLAAYQDKKDEATVRDLLPVIELRLQLRYDLVQAEFGTLAPFIVDLDPNCNEALLVIRYELKDGSLTDFLVGAPIYQTVTENPQVFFKLIRERIPKYFAVKIWAEDPNDSTNRRAMKPADLRHLVKTGFINAQRGLDDVTSKETDVLAKILEGLFSTASSELAEKQDKLLVDSLTEAVQEIQTQIDQGFGEKLKGLLPALKTFGYPGLGGQELKTETTLDVRRLLTSFTKVRYAGHGGIALPEAYNGLGVRNLIFILLQLVGFYKAYKAEQTSPGIHLIFIEEPEAHLHPQMQEVFIRQLSKIAKQLSEDDDSGEAWPVQFVVSTHSSHIANETGFENIRYFLGMTVPNMPIDVRHTKIKDLREGVAGKPEEVRHFLHQYLTLTRCDLFFADKAILVEGLSERLLLPIIIKKLEQAEPTIPKLTTQYNTIMEVGGAYAHIFFDLLEFLELRTLIVTDIDAVIASGGAACTVHKGNTTSNACIKAWFSDDKPLTLDSLKIKNAKEKTNGSLRIAFQCPEQESGPCGRTFEDAFILANIEKFGLTAAMPDALEDEAREEAAKLKKSEFALYYAITDTDWNSPKYFLEGLRWLSGEEASMQTPEQFDSPAAGGGNV